MQGVCTVLTLMDLSDRLVAFFNFFFERGSILWIAVVFPPPHRDCREFNCRTTCSDSVPLLVPVSGSEGWGVGRKGGGGFG
jgi:hypothetical protein